MRVGPCDRCSQPKTSMSASTPPPIHGKNRPHRKPIYIDRHRQKHFVINVMPLAFPKDMLGDNERVCINYLYQWPF